MQFASAYLPWGLLNCSLQKNYGIRLYKNDRLYALPWRYRGTRPTLLCHDASRRIYIGNSPGYFPVISTKSTNLPSESRRLGPNSPGHQLVFASRNFFRFCEFQTESEPYRFSSNFQLGLQTLILLTWGERFKKIYSKTWPFSFLLSKRQRA